MRRNCGRREWRHRIARTLRCRRSCEHWSSRCKSTRQQLAFGAVVCGYNAAQHILENREVFALSGEIEIPAWEFGDAVRSDEQVVVEHNWNEVRSVMWDYVGIVRSDRRLDRAFRRIRTIREEIRSYYKEYFVTDDLLELRNLAAVAELIIRSAQMRKESRGLHFTSDYPEKSLTRKIQHSGSTCGGF